MELAIIKEVTDLATMSLEEKVSKLGPLVLKEEQVNCPVIHRFGPNLYIREVFIPAGTFAIGHYQKFEHMNVMLKGRVSVIKDDGSVQELCAPMMFVSPPGRKVGYVHEDMVWLNIYSTSETDVDTLENWFLDKEASPWNKPEIVMDLDMLEEIRADFKDVITMLGFTEEQVWEMSSFTEDLVPFPNGDYSVVVSDSLIHGKGLFASANIQAGQTIAPGRIAGKRTPAGRYTNHSPIPNAKMVMDSCGDVSLVALTNIKGCSGGGLGEEITIDYYDTFINTRG